MLKIHKLPAPAGLNDFIAEKAISGEIASYNDFTAFQKQRDREGHGPDRAETPFFKLREQLLKEQKFLCAYCGQRILQVENPNGVPQMKTEHFNPQDDSPENDLDYLNLLACCLGNQNVKGENHCDSCKGDGKLGCLQNPALLASRDREIRYNILNRQNEVVVFSPDDLKDKELTGKSNGCLNLNFDSLRSRRFSTYKNEIQGKLGADQNLWDRHAVIELREKFVDKTIACHTEFADFIIWALDNWLGKFGA